MGKFDPANLNFVSIDEAKRRIQSAWVGQYRGTSYLSRLIQLGTSSVHSHSSMFRRTASGEVDVLELREFIGGRTKTLEYHAVESDRLIDVFACNAGIRWPHFKPDLAVETMRFLCDRSYGYWGVTKLGLRKVPGLWRLFEITNADIESGKQQPFCSHAVAWATTCGGVDPVPNCPSYLVTPGMLTTSMFYEYQFTIDTRAK
jgi:hypothetical protein